LYIYGSYFLDLYLLLQLLSFFAKKRRLQKRMLFMDNNSMLTQCIFALFCIEISNISVEIIQENNNLRWFLHFLKRFQILKLKLFKIFKRWIIYTTIWSTNAYYYPVILSLSLCLSLFFFFQGNYEIEAIEFFVSLVLLLLWLLALSYVCYSSCCSAKYLYKKSLALLIGSSLE